MVAPLIGRAALWLRSPAGQAAARSTGQFVGRNALRLGRWYAANKIQDKTVSLARSHFSKSKNRSSSKKSSRTYNKRRRKYSKSSRRRKKKR